MPRGRSLPAFPPAQTGPAIRSRALAGLLAGAVVLAACGSGDEPDQPVTATATATEVAGEPTPSSAPSPSPSPEPTGPPAPLTGLPLLGDDAEDVLARPAIVTKVENTTAAWPQAGLEDADIVIEELVEGGVTRFVALFQSTLPSSVGPIRSARLVDADLLPWLQGVLLYSGARPEVESAVRRAAPRLVTEGDTGVFRTADRSRPHNLFADVDAVLAGVDTTDLGPPESGLVFDEDVPAGARDCSAPEALCDGADATVVMSTVYRTGWTYDEADGVYRRTQNGTPQPTASGTPVGAANVVILGVPVGPGGCCDAAGSRYTSTTTTGEGRAIVLRDGEWFEAMWTRTAVTEPFLLSRGGTLLPLRPGTTWLHLTPAGNLPSAP